MQALSVVRKWVMLMLALLIVASSAGAQENDVPDWQKAAGGKMSFDVVSIHKEDLDTPMQNTIWMMGPDDWYKPSGGRFSGNFVMYSYISFAYKLMMTREQWDVILAQLPKWVRTDRFSIQARGPADATKDQMRLMMQSLLEERFGLKVHFVTRDEPVFAMVPVKEGKLGPKLHPHSEGFPCDKTPPDTPSSDPPAVWPRRCDVFQTYASDSWTMVLAARNTTMDLMAQSLSTWGAVGKPIVNRTGLNDHYDFIIKWFFEFDGVKPPNDNEAPTPPAFRDALRDQLGLKLEPARAPLRVLVVDHIEQPSAN
jgi:uncharacterized protein (TIGR03435 family)